MQLYPRSPTALKDGLVFELLLGLSGSFNNTQVFSILFLQVDIFYFTHNRDRKPSFRLKMPFVKDSVAC